MEQGPGKGTMNSKLTREHRTETGMGNRGTAKGPENLEQEPGKRTGTVEWNQGIHTVRRKGTEHSQGTREHGTEIGKGKRTHLRCHG